MALQYEITANLRLRGGGAGFARSMGRLSDRVRSFADRLRGTQTIAGGLLRSLISLGAGYVGFQALSRGIRFMVGGMLDFQRSVEQTRIGLQSIISAIDGISFEEARASAEAVWKALAEDALRSTATTQEMFDIFQGIVGPIRAAGQSLQTVRDITNSTVAAASALGVDFAQAQRDIGLMVRGTAGMDTRLFSLLRSMNLINQTTEEWNRNLTTQERITELQRALGNFDEAAAAYGQSFAGVTSSFRDIVQQLSASLAGPVFEQVTAFLNRINNLILANRDAIEQVLTRAGNAAAAAFSQVADQAFVAFNFLITHWDEISARMQEFGNQLRAHGPQLGQLAAALGVLSAARGFIAPLISMFSTLIAGLEALGLVGAGAVGAEAAVSGGAAAGGVAGLSSVLGPLAIVVALVAGAVVSLTAYWDQWLQIIEPMLPIFEQLWAEFQVVAALLWEVLRPVLKVIGTVFIVMLISALIMLAIVLRVLIRIVRNILTFFAAIANFLEEWIVDPFIEGILAIGAALSRMWADILGQEPARLTGQQAVQQAAAQERMAGVQQRLMRDPATERLVSRIGRGEMGPTGRQLPGLAGALAGRTPEELMGATPEARPQTVNNFHRGSVTVRQEFRQADPDRVMVRMINDIDAQAERRVQSGFAPSLTR
jgi:hypothetical protein